MSSCTAVREGLTIDPITEAQLRLRPWPCASPRTRQEYRRCARWWELEARRVNGAPEASSRYGRNMRWAAELAGLHGPGLWLDLLQRADCENPEARTARTQKHRKGTKR